MRSSLHRQRRLGAPFSPDFLRRLVASRHSMRLSLMKGAHADLSSTVWQEIGVKPSCPLVPSRRTGGPYLARFSRDVWFHCSFPLTPDSSDGLSDQPRWNPTSREKQARYGPPVLREGTRMSLGSG